MQTMSLLAGDVLVWYSLRGRSLYDWLMRDTSHVISSSWVGESMYGTCFRSSNLKSWMGGCLSFTFRMGAMGPMSFGLMISSYLGAELLEPPASLPEIFRRDG